MIVDTLLANLHLLVLGFIILGLLIFFLLGFCLPSWRLKGDLTKAIQGLLSQANSGQVINIDRIRNEAMA